MQLGCGAHRQHGRVERVESEPIGRLGQERVGLSRAEIPRQRQSLFV